MKLAKMAKKVKKIRFDVVVEYSGPMDMTTLTMHVRADLRRSLEWPNMKVTMTKCVEQISKHKKDDQTN